VYAYNAAHKTIAKFGVVQNLCDPVRMVDDLWFDQRTAPHHLRVADVNPFNRHHREWQVVPPFDVPIRRSLRLARPSVPIVNQCSTVIARKLSGGNRSESGRHAQQVLPSITRACR
jgi:hypothetical protein